VFQHVRLSLNEVLVENAESKSELLDEKTEDVSSVWPDEGEKEKIANANTFQSFYWSELRKDIESKRGKWIALKTKEDYRFYDSLKELLSDRDWWDTYGGFYEEIGNEVTADNQKPLILDEIHAGI